MSGCVLVCCWLRWCVQSWRHNTQTFSLFFSTADIIIWYGHINERIGCCWTRCDRQAYFLLLLLLLLFFCFCGGGAGFTRPHIWSWSHRSLVSSSFGRPSSPTSLAGGTARSNIWACMQRENVVCEIRLTKWTHWGGGASSLSVIGIRIGGSNSTKEEMENLPSINVEAGKMVHCILRVVDIFIHNKRSSSRLFGWSTENLWRIRIGEGRNGGKWTWEREGGWLQSNLTNGSIFAKKIIHFFWCDLERQILDKDDSVHLRGQPCICFLAHSYVRLVKCWFLQQLQTTKQQKTNGGFLKFD